MSDTWGGPGWWQASDGQWYPPEARSGDAAPSRPSSLADALAAQGAAPAPPATAPTEPTPEPRLGPNGRPQLVDYDRDGWIRLEQKAAPPPPPPPSGRAGLIVGVAVAAVAVALVGVLVVPKAMKTRTTDSARTETVTEEDEVTTTAPAATTDVLSLDSVMTDINVRYSDVGDGYEKAIDGAIDPLGGDGCTQPSRPFALVSNYHWVAYTKEAFGTGGIPMGHLASSVTVFESTDEAAKRLFTERHPDYVACLTRWDRGVWFDGSGYQPDSETMEPLAITMPTDTTIAYRYTATVTFESGQQVGLFTDHVVFTKDRVRVWIEVSSAIVPNDPALLDLLVRRLSKRLDAALEGRP